MKALKLTITILAFLLVTQRSFAQIDIINFHRVGLNNAQALLGNECATCKWTFCDGFYLLEESPNRAAFPEITLWDKTYSLRSFGTDSPKYVFLTGYVDGGLKVGDPLAKIQNVNFAKTKYGRNDYRNNCHRVNFYDGQEWYVIFGQTHQEIELLIENGIIKEIYLEWPDREEGFFPDNYDITNSMF